MKKLQNIDDATNRVLDIYHDLKRQPGTELTTQECMDTAIKQVYGEYGRDAEYEPETFESSIFTKLNAWKKHKPAASAPKQNPTAQQTTAEQLTLFAVASVRRIARNVKRKPGYETLTYANH